MRRGRCRIRSDNWNSDPHPPISAGARGLILCPAERQPKLRRFFAYLADGAAEECRRLRHGVTGFDALAQVNDIHLGPFPAGVGSFHPPGSLVALGRLKPQCNVYASAVRYLPLKPMSDRTSTLTTGQKSPSNPEVGPRLVELLDRCGIAAAHFASAARPI